MIWRFQVTPTSRVAHDPGDECSRVVWGRWIKKIAGRTAPSGGRRKPGAAEAGSSKREVVVGRRGRVLLGQIAGAAVQWQRILP